MVMVLQIGQPDCCEKARALIEQAMDSKEEKQKLRQTEYAKRDAEVGSCHLTPCRSDLPVLAISVPAVAE